MDGIFDEGGGAELFLLRHIPQQSLKAFVFEMGYFG